jgi:hypothetical protein
MKKIYLLLFFVLSTQVFAQFGSQDSGGKLSPLQACYDVKFYDLNLTIDLNEKAVAGSVIMRAQAVNDFNKILIDLDSKYKIDDVRSIIKNKKLI